MLFQCCLSVQTWVLDEVGLNQVVEDVVLMNPLHRAAAGGAKRRALHPARVAGSTKDVHARLQAEAKTRGSEFNSHCIVEREKTKVCFKPLSLDTCLNDKVHGILPDTVMQ